MLRYVSRFRPGACPQSQLFKNLKARKYVSKFNNVVAYNCAISRKTSFYYDKVDPTESIVSPREVCVKSAELGLNESSCENDDNCC